MPATRATTMPQRQGMARLADRGESYRVTAGQTGVSFWTARKWIRQARRGGLAALVTTLGRPAPGPMYEFDPLVRYVALRLKLEHKSWGAGYVVKMGERPSLHGKRLPSPTTVWRYWRSFGDRLFPQRRPAQPQRPLGVRLYERLQNKRDLSADPHTPLLTLVYSRFCSNLLPGPPCPSPRGTAKRPEPLCPFGVLPLWG